MSTVVPIGAGPRRLPQAGRIRIGEKGGKQGRRSLDRFRFTSPEERLLQPVAELYGGEVKPWKDAKSGDRWELRSLVSEIHVILPPDPLTESYELWSGEKGLERRCDGVTCMLAHPGPDGPELAPEPCLCAAAGALKCRYKLRLNVMLPEVPSIGTFRLDTGSDHARQEIPQVVRVIEMAQGRGLYRAVLRLEQRTAPGKRFNVPVLDPGVSIEALLAGESRLAVLPGSPSASAELTTGEGVAAGDAPNAPAAPSPDDDIIEGEIVPEHVDPTIARAWLDALDSKTKGAVLRQARELATERGEPLPTTAAAIEPPILDILAAEYLT